MRNNEQQTTKTNKKEATMETIRIVKDILYILADFPNGQTVAQIRRNLAYNFGHDDDLNSPLGFKTTRKQTTIIKGALDKMVTANQLERFLGLGERRHEARVYSLKAVSE